MVTGASRLLIVDDDRIFVESAGALARQEGFEVMRAGTLAQARKLLRGRRFDLLALDVKLPDGSGLELLEGIDPIGHGRIVVVTGNPGIASAMRAASESVVDCLVKPLNRGRWTELLRDARRMRAGAGDMRCDIRELRCAVQRAHPHGESGAIVVDPATARPGVLGETATSVLFRIGMTMAEVERRMLLKTLAHYRNDKTATARALGISVRTVHNHLARIARENDDPAT